MYEIEFYADASGNEPVKDFLLELQAKRDTDKSARIISGKIMTHIRVLQEYGTRAGMPYMRHLDGDIWELRPQPERILFFYCKQDKFIIYSQKTSTS